MKVPDAGELEKFRASIARLAGAGKYELARKLSLAHKKRFPDFIEFIYLEAVFGAEEVSGYSDAQITIRYEKAARKIAPLLKRLKSVEPRLRTKILNEYYWFSRQPLKQYRLGVKMVANGDKRAYYSQAVGAAQLAKQYAMDGQRSRCLTWASLSEKAWHKYFRKSPGWYEAYFFYAAVLGYQGKEEEMDAALATAAVKAGKTLRWKVVRECRADISETIRRIDT